MNGFKCVFNRQVITHSLILRNNKITEVIEISINLFCTLSIFDLQLCSLVEQKDGFRIDSSGNLAFMFLLYGEHATKHL